MQIPASNAWQIANENCNLDLNFYKGQRYFNAFHWLVERMSKILEEIIQFVFLNKFNDCLVGLKLKTVKIIESTLAEHLV